MDDESGAVVCTVELERCLGENFLNVRKSVLAYAKRVAGPGLAEDVVQETFLRVLKYCKGKDRAMTWSFLFAVARNVSRTLLADRKRDRAGLDGMAHERGGEIGTSDSSAEHLPRRITEEIACLPERQREALMLTEVHGLSEVQAGMILRMSRAAVGARRRAAIRRLRHVA